MDVKDIKKLLEAVSSSDVNEFTLDTGDYKIAIKRGVAVTTVAAPVVTSVPPVQAAPIIESSTPQEATPEPVAPVDSSLVEVHAPIVGTFYAAPSPDTANFVQVGDSVKKGAVLCIIEAMKLMNEIEAETSGTIAEILVSNEEPVEYGQTLFRIKPN